MPAPATITEFLELGRKAGLLEKDQAARYGLRAGQASGATPQQLAATLVKEGQLTAFQAQQLLLGRWHGFTLSNKYRLLDCIGAGGMGSVYLCEHLRMHRQVAIKVLPATQARDPANLERFYREARAVAALNHPNIVRAHDIDQDNQVHYLVMEYVEGDSLQNIIKKQGPLDPGRAAQYIAQAAAGLQHAHEAGLVHRDIKPANLLLDRQGVVRILDLGLARFFHDSQDEITKKHDTGAILGTADYLAPEQVEDSAVDIRADIYSLGATFYFLLAGHAPFHDKTVPQKLLCHRMRQPRPLAALRNDIPAGLAAVLDRMMAKKPEERFQQPQEIVRALLPWTQGAVAPPPQKRQRTEDRGQRTKDKGPPALPDISEIPTAITKPQEAPVPAAPAAAAAVIQAPVNHSRDDSSGAAPTSPSLSGADTDPFAVVRADGSLISDDSVFCSQFTRTGSSRGSNPPVTRRRWRLPLMLAGLAVLLALGSWLAYVHWSAPREDEPVSVPPPGPPVAPAPASVKSEYVAAGSPFGKMLRRIAAGAPVTGVALAPDGRKLIIGIEDRTPKLWDAQTGVSLDYLKGHAGAVTCVAFSPDGDTALTGSKDESLRLWDIKFRNEDRQLAPAVPPDKAKAVRCVTFVPPGQQAVSGGDDNLVHLWDVKAGNKIRSFAGHTQPVWAVAVAPDGRRLLSGAADGTARLWNLQDGKPLQEWKGHTGTVRAVAFSPEGQLAATGGQDKVIFLWDADNNKKLQSFTGHTGTITELLFAPNGRYLLSRAEDGTARIWDVSTGQELFRFGDLGQSNSGMALSADGTLLVLGGPGQEALLFRTPPYLHASPAGEYHLVDYKSSVEAVAFSPDGKLAASAGHDRVIRLWDVATLKPVREFPGHQDIITSLTFSPDGKRLLSASKDMTLRVWDVAKGNQLELYQATTPLQQALFAPDGQRILGAGGDNILRLWGLLEGKPAVVQEFTAETRPLLPPPALHTSLALWLDSPLGQGPWLAMSALAAGHAPFAGVAWSPNGQRLATAAGDKTILLWDAGGSLVQTVEVPNVVTKLRYTPDGSLLTNGGNLAYLWQIPATGLPVSQILAGHSDVVTALAVSDEGRFALTGDKSGAIILWDLAKLRPVHFFFGHKGAVKDLALAPGLGLALSGGEDGTVRLWHLPPCLADPKAGPLLEFGPHDREVEKLSLAPDGKTVATACRDGLVRLWDIDSGKLISTLSGHDKKAVLDVQFSPDGKWLASAGKDGNVRLWKVDSGKEIFHFTGHEGPVLAVAFSPDGKWLLSSGEDKMVCLWDLALTGSKAQEFRGHKEAVTGVAFVPGSQQFLTASADGTLGLWDLINGKMIHEFTNHTGPVQAVAVAPDGKTAVSGGADKTVCLWSLTDGKLLHTFAGHTAPVTCVAFSSDGQRVLSGSADKTVRLWSVPRRQLLQTLSGATDTITGVTFTPDGRQALSCGQDRVLRLWELPRKW
jgi:WD40 repeat protein/serine/threonine protein kinase